MCHSENIFVLKDLRLDLGLLIVSGVTRGLAGGGASFAKESTNRNSSMR